MVIEFTLNFEHIFPTLFCRVLNNGTDKIFTNTCRKTCL